MRGLRRQGRLHPPGRLGLLDQQGSLDPRPPRRLSALRSPRPSPEPSLSQRWRFSRRLSLSGPLSPSLDPRPSRRLSLLRRRGERGSAALFVAMFAPAMIFMAGLVIDGGAALEAKQRASDIAEQAARAGAGQCDVALLRSQGICFVDKGLVPAAVAPYRNSPGVTDFDWVPLADPNHPGQDNGVRVMVTMTFHTTLLGIMPNFKTLTITERADAVAVTGL
jgi:Putative Flp pilus-assembly TadE/G-like